MTQFNAPATESPSVEATPEPQQHADVVPEKDDSTTLLATYQDVTGHPYSANYFEVTNIWNREDHGYQVELESIDNYLQEQIRANKLDNSTREAMKFMKNIEKKAGVEPGDSTHLRIIKTQAYIKMRNEIDKAMKESSE